MLAHTLDRVRGIVRPEDVWILTALDLKAEAERIAPEVLPAHVVGEPAGKNTAPAIALASWWLRDAGEDLVVAVLPSDHRVEPTERFREELLRAGRVALERGAILTFGIPPTRAETGYGYIESGEAVDAGSGVHAVRAFREKPDPEAAARYASDGRHLWNAGLFVFPPRLMLQDLTAHRPGLASLLPRVPGPSDPGVDEAIRTFYEAAPSVSIDYAVMERSRHALVQRAGFTWDDLGSWAALARPDALDPDGNVIRGLGVLQDCRGVVAFAEGGLVAAIGLTDLVIVRTADVTLVCPRDRAQEVRAIVERLKARRELDGFL